MAQGGFSNLLWFMGVVEDRRDPRKMGRVKVRCFDIHPDSKEDVPTADLPWAIPVLGNFDTNYKPPLEGSWVFGFFIDGRDAQHPLVIGILPGMPTDLPDSDKPYSGFDVFPKPQDLYQPDMTRLSRAENIEETNVARRYNNREEVPGYDWEEPLVPYNTEYPYSKVQQTESGHVMEFDDTPGSERINIEHRTGTFTEISPNGSKTTKVVGDNYEIIECNNKVMVKGNVDVVIKGANKVNIEGNCDLEVNGNMNTTVHGNYKLDVAGSIEVNAAQHSFLKASGIRQEAYMDSINSYAKKNHHMEAGANVSIHANTGVLWTYSQKDTRMQTDTNFGLYVTQDSYTKVDGNMHYVTVGSAYTKTTGDTNFVTGGSLYTLTTGKTNIKSTGAVAVEGSRIDLNTAGAADDGTNAEEDPMQYVIYNYSPYGANPSLRTLLPDAPDYYFKKIITKTVEPYPIFTDPIDTDSDTHTLEISSEEGF